MQKYRLLLPLIKSMLAYVVHLLLASTKGLWDVLLLCSMLATASLPGTGSITCMLIVLSPSFRFAKISPFAETSYVTGARIELHLC